MPVVNPATLFHPAVAAWFNRSDGCQIERWNRVRVLFNGRVVN